MTALICSFFLLWLSFPLVDLWIFAWFSLVPFLCVLDGKKRIAAFAFGYGLGLLFFTATLYWLIHVTFVGMILVILYLALYFGFFALGYRFFSARPLAEKLLFIPSLWVALEFIRAHFLSGFGWVLLGHSQYKNLMMIQIADLTGVAGVSFMVMMVNVLLKEWVDVLRHNHPELKKKIILPTVFVMALLFIIGGYGVYHLKRRPILPTLKVAVVQGNIPLEVRGTKSLWPSILEQYLQQTTTALAVKPDLIIWPETAFPGFLWEAPSLFEDLKRFVAQERVPLLLGAATQENGHYYNSALLISPTPRHGGAGLPTGQAGVVKQYNKLHLVPFGEYIPLRSVLPFLENIVPIDDFTAGTEYTLFPIALSSQVKIPNPRLAVLICFEDTIPGLSRGFTQRGASLLVNMTNDAWFQDTAAPFFHLQASVFRTIENRRSLIRCANTGVSGFIDPQGRVIRYLENSEGRKTTLAGHASANVAISDETTPYTKLGDVFTYLCFGCILVAIKCKIFT